MHTTALFIFENMITKFGCPKSLISDQSKHFINCTTETLTKETMIQHHMSVSYFSQHNGIVESCNIILEHGLTNFCTINWKIGMKGYMFFFGLIIVVLVEFVVPRMFILQDTHMFKEHPFKKGLLS